MLKRPPLAVHLAELVVVWVGLPTVVVLMYRWGRWQVNPLLLLWAAAAVCGVMLWRDGDFDRRQLWSAGPVWPGLRAVLLRAAVLGPVMVAVIWASLAWGLLGEGRQFMAFPRHRPGWWAVVMVAYPVLSVWPQGLIFRCFFLHRYRWLANRPGVLEIVAGLIFGYTHIVFLNPVAPLVTVIGGAMFARTHLKSRSLLVSSIEHAIYGCLLITFGWGKFFYHGSLNLSG